MYMFHGSCGPSSATTPAKQDGREDGVVPEMLMGTASADCHWAVALWKATRGCHSRRSMGPLAGASACEDRRANFDQILRPIAILKASAKRWSSCFYGALEKYDITPNAAHMGVKKTYACVESVQVVRLLLSERSEWGLETRIAHADFARAYDSILHTATVAMRCRGVPEPLAIAYIREARRACMTLSMASGQYVRSDQEWA